MEYMRDIGYIGKWADIKFLCTGDCCDLVFQYVLTLTSLC